MKSVFILLVAVIVLIIGCVERPEKSIVKGYQCPEGTVVNDIAQCKKIITTTTTSITTTTPTTTTTTTTTNTTTTTTTMSTITITTMTITTTTTPTSTSTTVISGFSNDAEGYATIEGSVSITPDQHLNNLHVMAIYNNSVIRDTYTDDNGKYKIIVPASDKDRVYNITVDLGDIIVSDSSQIPSWGDKNIINFAVNRDRGKYMVGSTYCRIIINEVCGGNIYISNDSYPNTLCCHGGSREVKRI